MGNSTALNVLILVANILAVCFIVLTLYDSTMMMKIYMTLSAILLLVSSINITILVKGFRNN